MITADDSHFDELSIRSTSASTVRSGAASRVSSRGSSAFSLVELVLVIVIIGTLAAIAIPRVSSASGNSKLASLQQSVSVVSQQLELYTAEHNGRTPDLNHLGVATGSSTQFVQRLTERTDINGKLNADGRYGPYLVSFPVNPFNGKDNVRVGGAAAGQNSHGWHFDSSTGVFSADDDSDHAAL